MIASLFSTKSRFKKQARVLALLWTLLIVIGCFAPASSFPKVDVPLADKWVHFVLFGGFTFFWSLVNPELTVKRLGLLFVKAILFGCFIELMQGLLTFLGRSMELMDAVADTIGAALGLTLFLLCAWSFGEKNIRTSVE